jgi:ABC-2 type transport system ATP-binding protein
MLKCVNITKIFKEKTVIENLSFNVKKGEVFALLGSNGAGKTTTIKIILGLINQDSGSIEIEPNIKIGYSPETPYFHPFLTEVETMEYYAKLQRIDKSQMRKEIKEILNIVGLENGGNTKVRNYSKGMTQKLALAQALLGNPDLLILDEPTAGLDALSRINILETINRLKKEGKTIIFNSHILNDVEKVANRGIILKDGRNIKYLDKNDFAKGSLEQVFVNTIGGVGVESNTL